MIQINSDTGIPEDEFSFSASRSSGPGGQNVNKLSTRVTLKFDVKNSRALTEQQKRLVRKKLSGRINKEGILQVVVQEFRTQGANRRRALEKFVSLLATALKRKRIRRRTTVPKKEKLRRLEQKRRRSQIKQDRSRPSPDF